MRNMLTSFALFAGLATETKSNLGPIKRMGERPTVPHLG
jgi:hypothetical protein